VQVLQQNNLLMDEQKVSEPNPLYSLANVTRHTSHNSIPTPTQVHARTAH